MTDNETKKSIAHACIALWNDLHFDQAYERYYADHATKVEPVAWHLHPNEVSGRASMAEHEQWLWDQWVIVHSIRVSDGPFIGANGFSVILESDFTMRDTGQRHLFREVGVFTIEGGKIVREEFFYDENELAEAERMNQVASAGAVG